MTPDEIRALAIEDGIKAQNDAAKNHQGFLYGDRHVIRDLSKPRSQQEVWAMESLPGEYEVAHKSMENQLKKNSCFGFCRCLRARLMASNSGSAEGWQ